MASSKRRVTRSKYTSKGPDGRPAATTCRVNANEHKNFPEVGQWKFCHTPNQEKVLFANTADEPIGCGAFACAYARLDGDVTKITRDAEDVSSMLEAQGVPHIAKIRAAYRLKGEGQSLRKPGKKFPVYAMVVERLQPVPEHERAWRDGVMDRATDLQEKGADLRAKGTFAQVAEECHGAGKAEGTCRRFGQELLETLDRLQKRGVTWHDAHTGNIAFDKAGNWKVIDLGITGHKKNAGKVPVLNGAKIERHFARVRPALHARLKAIGAARAARWRR